MSDTARTATHILIAADSPFETLALESLLRAAGHREVRTTSDAREIVPLHDRWPYKMLLLDMGIRPHSGLDVLERLAERIDRRQLTVLALIDAGDQMMQDRARGLGVVHVLARPFTRTEALLQVSAALRAG